MDTKTQVLIVAILAAALAVAGFMLLRPGREEAPPPMPAPVTATTFTVRIENIAGEDAIVTSEGSTVPFAISPVAWVVHSPDVSLFTVGVSALGAPLERLAEDGNPVPLAESLDGAPGVASVGTVDTPVGADGPGPAAPVGEFEFHVTATPGMRLSFATMFGQSNDLFYAPDPPGIELFYADGTPASGDVTGMVFLWDAGTEVNQEPGLGSDQAPRQAAPNTGEDENGVVQLVDDGYTYPPVLEVIRVTITPQM
jgi:hypothetical protein